MEEDLAKHHDKVAAVLDFLNDDPEVDIHVLMVIGDCQTGKKSAIEDALESYTPNNWNIMVWPQGTVPSYYFFADIDSPKKWIIARQDSDKHALLTHGILEEWYTNPEAQMEMVTFGPDDAYTDDASS